MGYFRELPDLAYQNFLSDSLSSQSYIEVKNLFRRNRIRPDLENVFTVFDKYEIREGARPDTIAEQLYGDPFLDYIVILVAGITNINHQWPLQDYQVYDFALQKYGSEEKMNEIKYYETLEIIDDQGRQIVPPNLIVDADFKVDGTVNKFPSSTRYTLKALTGNRQLDDKDEFTVLTDNIARAITNLEYEYTLNEKKREINVLSPGYVPVSYTHLTLPTKRIV